MKRGIAFFLMICMFLLPCAAYAAATATSTTNTTPKNLYTIASSMEPNTSATLTLAESGNLLEAPSLFGAPTPKFPKAQTTIHLYFNDKTLGLVALPVGYPGATEIAAKVEGKLILDGSGLLHINSASTFFSIAAGGELIFQGDITPYKAKESHYNVPFHIFDNTSGGTLKITAGNFSNIPAGKLFAEGSTAVISGGTFNPQEDITPYLAPGYGFNTQNGKVYPLAGVDAAAGAAPSSHPRTGDETPILLLSILLLGSLTAIVFYRRYAVSAKRRTF